jgi:hypothetical protein
VVAEQVVERAVLAQGDALSTGVVVLGDDTVGDFVVVADEVGGDVVDGLGDALAVTVVEEGGAAEGERGEREKVILSLRWSAIFAKNSVPEST